MFVAALAIVLTLLLVVGIHEAGHALVARFFHVKIKKISIGFGRPLLQWQSKSGIQWIWAMWPLGGYVQLLNSRISPVDPQEYSACFDKQSIGVRILILLAGALANLITAWLAFILVFYIGMNYKIPQILAVQPNSIAALAGIKPGDQFLSIAGHPTPSWQDVGMDLVVLWGNKDVKVSLSQSHSKETKEIILDLSQIRFSAKTRSLLSAIGIDPYAAAPSVLKQAPSLSESMFQAGATMGKVIYFFLMILKHLVSGVIPFFILLGPLGLFHVSIVSLMQGAMVFTYFIATFSMAVAVINLLPIPGLDGGSILYGIIEKVRGKAMSVAMEVLLYQLMFIVFCLLLVQLGINDFLRYFNVGF